ncbi:helix-turn-helix domain-containing protein [Chryseobacterium polytrichastri]|uniref:AraC-type DNA-binding protein n=1 Tax=Chryseobacterium polytrichastri TaxID=1302687 RepID=A0A1M7H990_9FLAO|nr:helix-turn-helix domain-containing protein [Chryseobacterium polytrichastri]SHM25172.1 AraC-type DNA-binding protein [Chryseobacterium polytrichastri]
MLRIASLILDNEIKDSFRISRLDHSIYNEGSLISVTYNRIFIIQEGKGSVIIDDKEFEINSKEVLLISKGQIFSFSPLTTLSGFEISFGDCFWEKAPASASNCKLLLFNDAALHQKISLQEKDFIELDPICKILLIEYLSDDYPNKLDAMAAYLKILMIKLANLAPSYNEGIDDFDNQIYRKFLELVSTEYHQMHDVLYYAEKLLMTPRKLSDISKKKSGKGAKEIIAGQIIAESKRLLQFSAKTIKEIAYELSFSTPEQFSHFFKKYTNTSPLDYRKIFVNIGR